MSNKIESPPKNVYTPEIGSIQTQFREQFFNKQEFDNVLPELKSVCFTSDGNRIAELINKVNKGETLSDTDERYLKSIYESKRTELLPNIAKSKDDDMLTIALLSVCCILLFVRVFFIKNESVLYYMAMINLVSLYFAGFIIAHTVVKSIEKWILDSHCRTDDKDSLRSYFKQRRKWIRFLQWWVPLCLVVVLSIVAFVCKNYSRPFPVELTNDVVSILAFFCAITSETIENKLICHYECKLKEHIKK